MSQNSLNTLDLTKTKPIMGHELYNTEEFKALCRLLNIAWEQRTTDINIFIPCEGLVTVTQTYYVSADERALDTTSTHNKQFPTKMPKLTRIGENSADSTDGD